MSLSRSVNGFLQYPLNLFPFAFQCRNLFFFQTFCDIKDLSYGRETVPISCVNGIDRQYPDYVEYSNQRIPAKGVHLNLDPEFMVGCDCTDGCRVSVNDSRNQSMKQNNISSIWFQDPAKCACIQMTMEASRALYNKRSNLVTGYKNRRLMEPVITG